MRSILRTVRWLQHPYAVLDEARARHGLTFWMDLAFSGRALVTGDPSLVREIAAGESYDGAYFPFGFSPRTCIGRPFAMRQMTLVTSTLLRHLDLALLPGWEPRPERRLVLILPRGGTPMVAA